MPEPEFSRDVSVQELPPEGNAVEVAADAGERAALAARLGLVAVDALRAAVVLSPAAIGEGAVRVTGELRAHITQRCVVTLEPFEATVTEPVEALFVRGLAEDDAAMEAFDPDEELPEPLLGDTIDIGELVVEHLAVALDPYPRSPATPADEVAYSVGPDGVSSEIETEKGPFAALGELRRKM